MWANNFTNTKTTGATGSNAKSPKKSITHCFFEVSVNIYLQTHTKKWPSHVGHDASEIWELRSPLSCSSHLASSPQNMFYIHFIYSHFPLSSSSYLILIILFLHSPTVLSPSTACWQNKHPHCQWQWVNSKQQKACKGRTRCVTSTNEQECGELRNECHGPCFGGSSSRYIHPLGKPAASGTQTRFSLQSRLWLMKEETSSRNLG